MLLFLFSSCCISSMGPRGLLHNRMIPGRNLVTGVVIARTLLYARLPTDAPTRTSFFLVHGWRISQKTLLVKVVTPTSLFYKEVTCKSSTKKSCKEHFKCLILDTLLWCNIMSTSLKNPEERKKGMLSDQPWLMRVTSKVILCRWGQQLLKYMTSLGTDFEMHAIWQGCIEEPAAKDFIGRKACTITLSKAQGTHGDVIKCKERLRIAQKLS